MLFFSLGSLLVWLFFLLFIHLSTHKAKRLVKELKQKKPREISILICARNEADNISTCLQKIDLQSIADVIRIRVIIVDDHSDDDTVAEVKRIARSLKNLKLQILSNNGEGKKDALQTGLSIVDSDYLFLTDADCFLSENCIETHLITFASKDNTSVSLGQVSFMHDNYLERLISYEGLNNMVVTEALVNRKNASMANGGNMMIRRNAFPALISSLQQSSASGDDVFFLEKIFENGQEVVFSRNAIVSTKPEKSLLSFIQQRVRWASKRGAMNDMLSRILPVFVFLINGSFIMSLFFLGAYSLFYVLFFLGLKVAIEFIFQSSWFNRYKVKYGLGDAIVLSVLYPFYTLLIGTWATVNPNYEWKSRTYNRGLRR